MPDPTRPVAGAPIDTDWGQQIHDRVFQPKGVRVSTVTAQSVGSSFEQLHLDVATDDPGGWLATHTLTVPTDAGRLYLWALRIETDNGDASERSRVQLRVNGQTVDSQRIDQEGTSSVFTSRAGLFELAAGDEIEVWATKTGGSNPDIRVVALDIIEQGTSIGA